MTGSIRADRPAAIATASAPSSRGCSRLHAASAPRQRKPLTNVDRQILGVGLRRRGRHVDAFFGCSNAVMPWSPAQSAHAMASSYSRGVFGASGVSAVRTMSKRLLCSRETVPAR